MSSLKPGTKRLFAGFKKTHKYLTATAHRKAQAKTLRALRSKGLGSHTAARVKMFTGDKRRTLSLYG